MSDDKKELFDGLHQQGDTSEDVTDAVKAKKKQKEHPQEEPFDLKKEIISWIKMFISVIVIVLVLTQVVFINARIPSGSMEDTLQKKDRLIGFRFSYWFDEPERGDIVLFIYPVDGKTMYIKRVIGLPGETVDISDGKVYINGSDTPLQEDYLKEEWVIANEGYHFEVPEDCYFVMGDNRNNSLDGRYWADEAIRENLVSTAAEAESYSYVPADNIKGKAIFKYFKGFQLLNKDVYGAE